MYYNYVKLQLHLHAKHKHKHGKIYYERTTQNTMLPQITHNNE